MTMTRTSRNLHANESPLVPLKEGRDFLSDLEGPAQVLARDDTRSLSALTEGLLRPIAREGDRGSAIFRKPPLARDLSARVELAAIPFRRCRRRRTDAVAVFGSCLR
jgi:hypothetical protein